MVSVIKFVVWVVSWVVEVVVIAADVIEVGMRRWKNAPVDAVSADERAKSADYDKNMQDRRRLHGAVL